MSTFFAYSNGRKVTYVSVAGVSVGGITIEDDAVTLYAPRIPPLRISDPNPKMVKAVGALCVGVVTGRLLDTGGIVDINNAMQNMLGAIDELTEAG